MTRLVERYRTETAGVQTKTRVMNAFTIAGASASLAASFVFPPIGIAGGFIALARLGAERLLAGALTPEARRGAMFADARKHFGWTV
jgi:hypothetical protein